MRFPNWFPTPTACPRTQVNFVTTITQWHGSTSTRLSSFRILVLGYVHFWPADKLAVLTTLFRLWQLEEQITESENIHFCFLTYKELREAMQRVRNGVGNSVFILSAHFPSHYSKGSTNRKCSGPGHLELPGWRWYYIDMTDTILCPWWLNTVHSPCLRVLRGLSRANSVISYLSCWTDHISKQLRDWTNNCLSP